MPTATATITKTSFHTQLPLKVGLLQATPLPATPDATPPSSTSQASTAATLRSLYNRATRAFVLRDITLTFSLIQSAFSLLKPPSNLSDSLSDHRRKWDILRITFESTVYLTPSTSQDSIPESLRANLTDPPQTLATSTYTRSLTLFTPPNESAQKTTLNAAYLPSQVLTTLIYFSLKINAPDVGRVMIEDWLARREPHYSLDAPDGQESDGYEKILELYCLHVLPKLQQWEYAREFLESENELSVARREQLRSSLDSSYAQAMPSRRVYRTVSSLPSSQSSTPRPYSPTPSSSSSSSSLSTTSTHTVVPGTPRGNRVPANLFRMTGLTNIPSSSSSSTGTATPHSQQPQVRPNGNHRPGRPRSGSKTASSTSSAYTTGRSHLVHQATTAPANLSAYALIRESIAPYLTSTKVTTFLILFVLVPLISFLLRVRRRKRFMALDVSGVVAPNTAVKNADLVRRRLQTVGGGVDSGLISRAWSQVIRVMGDTVRMAGSGLV